MRNFYAGKNVVVAGGAGFIGSHIVEQLVALDAHVTVLDNLVTGKKENLDVVASSITFVQGTIQDAALCHQVLQNCALVFHLAAQVSVPESFLSPEECYATNITGTFNLLEAARAHHVKRFIFSSSSAVYGNQQDPCSETAPTDPLSPYAYSKLLGEELCRQYAKLFAVPALCLRYFNVCGPRQDPHSQYAGVVAKFRKSMAQNMPLTVFGDGTQTRDFIPVQQVVQANLALAMLPPDQCNGQPINIATGTSISLLQLIKELKTEFPNYKQPLTFEPERVGDIKHSEAQCDQFKKLMKSLSK